MEIEVENLPKGLRRRGLAGSLADICVRNDIVFMGLFGSFVRGEQNRKSDVDLAIEFDQTKRKTLLDLVRVEEELSKVFGRKVDLGILSSLSPYIVNDVKSEMLVLYETRQSLS